MSIVGEKNSVILPSEAKDIRLNLQMLFTEDPVSDLTLESVFGIVLSVAYALGDDDVVHFVRSQFDVELDSERVSAAKTAAVLMSMNNVYYRSAHYCGQPDLLKRVSGLRMNAMKSVGIEKSEFEAYSLAVSALNGCGLCVKSHTDQLIKAGWGLDSVAKVFRISACVNALSCAVRLS